MSKVKPSPICAVLLIACSSSEPEPPAPAPRAASPAPAITLVGCAPAHRFTLAPASVWAPYAASEPARDATAVTAAVRERLTELVRCTNTTGSIVAMIGARVRVGGLGVKSVEDCIGHALAGVRTDGEVECGLTFGTAGPLRVTPDAGYAVREIGLIGIRRDAPHPSLVIADPDTPGGTLAAALEPGELVAVRAAGGAPVLLGIVDSPDRAQLRVDGGKLDACGGEGAPLLDARALDAVVARACTNGCGDRITIGNDGRHTAKDLVAAASAIRRAHRDPVIAVAPACTSKN